MKRILNLGKIDYMGNGRAECEVTIEINTDGGNVSICGSIWNPRRTDIYAGGQCLDTIAEFFPHNKRVLRIVELWRRWHLNDMKANCAHQTGQEWDAAEPVTTYFFRLRETVRDVVNAAKKRAAEAVKTGEIFQATEDERRAAVLPSEIRYHEPVLPIELAADYEADGPHYAGDTYHGPSKTDRAGWVPFSQHPKGLLSKPCPVCGYAYGSAWLREEVPAGVLHELETI